MQRVHPLRGAFSALMAVTMLMVAALPALANPADNGSEPIVEEPGETPDGVELSAVSNACGEVTVTLTNPNDYQLIADFGFGEPTVERPYSGELLTAGPYVTDPPSTYGLFYADEPATVEAVATSENGASFMAVGGENSHTMRLPEDAGEGSVEITYRVKSGAVPSDYVLPRAITVVTDCEQPGDPGDGQNDSYLRLLSPGACEDTVFDHAEDAEGTETATGRVFCEDVTVTGDTVDVDFETDLDETAWGVFGGPCSPYGATSSTVLAAGADPGTWQIDADVDDGSFCLLVGAERHPFEHTYPIEGTEETRTENPDDLRVGRTITLDRPEPTPPPQQPRVAGEDRVETAIEVSEETYPEGADYAFIARDDLYPDSLTAGPLAAQHEGPILLTDSDTLDESTAAELHRLDAADGQADLQVFILGGDAAVSPGVAQRVDELFTAERIGGADRFHTAALIAGRIDTVDTVYVATGRDFPDAMVAGLASGLTDGAVLLADTDAVSDHTLDAIAALDPETVVAVGGEAVLSAEVVDATGATRIAGENRYETTALVAAAVFAVAGDPDTVYLTNGATFPDTLAVAPTAILGGDAILMTHTDELPASVGAALAEWKPDTVVAIGGTAAVSDVVLAAAARSAS